MPKLRIPTGGPPATLWAVPAFLDYVQPPLTSAVVAAAEAQLGVRLPAAYVALLSHQNGGYVRGSQGVADRVFGIGPRYPSITLDAAWWRPKNAEPQAWAPERPELLVPFDGDGHWDMCFDYRGGGPRSEPSITLVEVDNQSEEKIASNFLEYLGGLVDESLREAIRVYGEEDVERLARGIARHLGAPEPTVDTASYGYPTWRVALGASRWGWCSPNRVPRGFRREGRAVVVTDETALRLPEDPDCTAFVSATEESAATVAGALSALRLVTRPGPG